MSEFSKRKEMSDFLGEIVFESPSDVESPPQAKKRKIVTFDNVVRTPSNPDGKNVMTIEEQESIVEEHDRPLIEQGINPKNTYRQYKGKNQTAHGPSKKTHPRNVIFNEEGTVIDSDPDKLWIERNDKPNAIKDQQSSRNFVKNNNNKTNYERIKELISNNTITPDYPMKMNGQDATAKDFINMYEEHKISAAEKDGGKKNKKNRKTKRKSKRKNKRKTLSKKSKRKSKRKTSNKKSKH